LAMFDPVPVDPQELKNDESNYLKAQARENVQLAINKLFSLPVSKREKGEMGVYVELPLRTTIIPREKPVPQVRPMTKWEKFAKEKGITNTKKKEMNVLDENTGEIRPRFGFNRAGKEGDEDWAIEFKPGDDPTVDPFTKKKQEKKERVLKNEKARKANIARISKLQKEDGLKLPSVALSNQIHTSLGQKQSNVMDAINLTQRSTISMGKFDQKLNGEKKIKAPKKYESLFVDESEKNAKALKKALNPIAQPTVAMSKAINQAMVRGNKKRKQSQLKKMDQNEKKKQK